MIGMGIAAVIGVAIATSTRALADGPGMLVYSGSLPRDEHFKAPFRRFRVVGDLGMIPWHVGLPLILANGRPFVFAPSVAAGAAMAVIPADVGTVREIGACQKFVLAITDAGTVRAWGVTVPGALPGGSHVDLSMSGSAAALVGADGRVRVFDHISALATSEVVEDASRVSISID